MVSWGTDSQWTAAPGGDRGVSASPGCSLTVSTLACITQQHWWGNRKVMELSFVRAVQQSLVRVSLSANVSFIYSSCCFLSKCYINNLLGLVCFLPPCSRHVISVWDPSRCLILMWYCMVPVKGSSTQFSFIYLFLIVISSLQAVSGTSVCVFVCLYMQIHGHACLIRNTLGD